MAINKNSAILLVVIGLALYMLFSDPMCYWSYCYDTDFRPSPVMQTSGPQNSLIDRALEELIQKYGPNLASILHKKEDPKVDLIRKFIDAEDVPSSKHYDNIGELRVTGHSQNGHEFQRGSQGKLEKDLRQRYDGQTKDNQLQTGNGFEQHDDLLRRRNGNMGVTIIKEVEGGSDLWRRKMGGSVTSKMGGTLERMTVTDSGNQATTMDLNRTQDDNMGSPMSRGQGRDRMRGKAYLKAKIQSRGGQGMAARKKKREGIMKNAKHNTLRKAQGKKHVMIDVALIANLTKFKKKRQGPNIKLKPNNGSQPIAWAPNRQATSKHIAHVSMFILFISKTYGVGIYSQVPKFNTCIDNRC